MKPLKIGCALVVLVIVLGALAAACGGRYLSHRHYHPVRHAIVRHIVTRHVYHHVSLRRH